MTDAPLSNDGRPDGRYRTRKSRTDSTAREVVVIALVSGIVGVALVLFAVVNNGKSPRQKTSIDAALATTTYAGTPFITETQERDPGIVTHIALLTASPYPLATKPTDPIELTAQVPTPDPSAPPEPTLVAGLADLLQGPFEPSMFSLQNQWQGPVGSDTHWMIVGAGAKKNETDGSVGPAAVSIYEFTTTPEGRYAGNFAHVGLFVAPIDSGPLTIAAVNGSVVELYTDGGETLSFNLGTLTYDVD